MKIPVMKKSGEVVEARLKEIASDLARYINLPDGRISDKQVAHMRNLREEGEELLAQQATEQKATSMANYAAPDEYNMQDRNPDNGASGFGFSLPGIPGMENQIRPQSVDGLDKTQIKALQAAAQQKTPLKVTIGSKGLEHGHFAGLRDKAAMTEAFSPNLLPPNQQPGPYGFWNLPYESTSLANYIPNIAADGPGVAWFRHDSNGAEAAYTAEAATKPDISPVVSEQFTRFSKIAGQVNLTHELVMDAGDTFAGYMQTELARSYGNALNNLLLNGTTGANGFPGINQVSGTLTRAIGSDSPLDCLNKAFADLRVDYFEPDLVVIHPNTLSALRRTKDLNNRYMLDLFSSARGIDQTSDTENLWGVTVVQSVQQAAGTAAVLSVKSGAAVLYVREALTSFFDPYSQSANNIYRFIVEGRVALATPRVSAINLISGLPTS